MSDVAPDSIELVASQMQRYNVTVDQLVAIYDPSQTSIEHTQLLTGLQRMVPSLQPRDLQVRDPLPCAV